MTTKKIIVAAKNHNDRLDVFLTAELGTTRSQVEKLFKKELAKINGELPKKSGQQVKTGDTIVINEDHPAPLLRKEGATGGGSNDPSLRRRGLGGGQLTLTPTIIAETPDYVVINKPSGLLVHPTMAKEKDSLVAWLLKKYPKIKTVGDDPAVRPGIVHRLDKEASGLMVIARTQTMFDHLKEQFKTRTVEKEYLALVHGKVAKDWDEITFPIARSETFDRMAARPAPKDSNALTAARPTIGGLSEGEKEAHTEFLVERRFVNFGLLRVTIHTGRMHQIRVHLLAYNHPLVGDPLYFQKKQKRTWDEKLGRLFLHSAKLAFTDLAGAKQTFESKLPQELTDFLTLLK